MARARCPRHSDNTDGGPSNDEFALCLARRFLGSGSASVVAAGCERARCSRRDASRRSLILRGFRSHDHIEHPAPGSLGGGAVVMIEGKLTLLAEHRQYPVRLALAPGGLRGHEQRVVCRPFP